VLRGAETITNLTLLLWKPASLSGSVADSEGKPVVGAQVGTLFEVLVSGEPKWAAGPAVLTDDRGVYRISNLGAGECVLVLTGFRVDQPLVRSRDGLAVDGRARGRLYYPQAVSPALAQRMSVTFGQDLAGLDFRIGPSARQRISGQVVGPSDATSDVLLRLVREDDISLGFAAETAIVRSAGNGRFTFTDVPAGRYVIRATPSVGHLALSSAASPALPKGFQLRGGLRQTDGIAVSTFGPAETSSFWGETRIDVLDEDLANVEVRMKPAARIAGTVFFKDQPQPKATVVAESSDGRLEVARVTGRTGDEGKFEIAGLLPGRYFLRVSGTRVVRSISWNGREVSGMPVDVGDGQELTAIVLSLSDDGAAISGTVLDNQNRLTPDAIVVHFPTNPDEWTNYGVVSDRLDRALVNSAGEYRITGLPAGEYFIAAARADDSSGGEWRAPSFLRALAARASRIRVEWGDVKTVPLKVQ
jgi:hypothetical protein